MNIHAQSINELMMSRNVHPFCLPKLLFLDNYCFAIVPVPDDNRCFAIVPVPDDNRCFAIVTAFSFAIRLLALLSIHALPQCMATRCL